MTVYNKLKILTIIIGATFIALLTGCTPTEKGDYTKGIATIYCDQGFKNVISQEVEVFEYQYSEATIRVKYTNEIQAIDSLLDEKTRAAIVARELSDAEIKHLQERDLIVRQRCIAIDAVALITNPSNPINLLTMSDVEKIMRGDVSTWRQLGWNDTTKIKIIFDNPGSSTTKFMREKFLQKGQNFPQNAFAQKNTAQVLEMVKSDPSALGIISVNWLGEELNPEMKIPVEQRLPSLENDKQPVPASIFPDDIKILKICKDDEIEGFQPYQAYIYDGRYPLFRKVYMISTAPTSSLVHSFYSFVTGTIGQKIILYTGIVPFNDQLRIVELK